MKKLAFVIPWYPDRISGGAEQECKQTAHALHAAGYRVEILTTCIQEFRSNWNTNAFTEGVTYDGSIPVRRFKVHRTDQHRFHEMNTKLMQGLKISDAEQDAFIREMMDCPGLTQYIKKHADEYLYIMIPYMFRTTWEGVLAAPESSILFPCLHDESYTQIQHYAEMFQAARGILYNSPAERTLAHRLYRTDSKPEAVMGMGVDRPNLKPDAERFRIKYGLDRYLLYVGRKDHGKGIQKLVDSFTAYSRLSQDHLKLVLMGQGEWHYPEDLKNRTIIDLGFCTEQEKWDAMQGALALCNPSTNESFSIVLMESWLNETPVIVNGKCEVMKSHCEWSKGGFYFTSLEEFCAAIMTLDQEPELRARLGRNGRAYVEKNYLWPHLIEKYVKTFRDWGFELEKRSSNITESSLR